MRILMSWIPFLVLLPYLLLFLCSFPSVSFGWISSNHGSSIDQTHKLLLSLTALGSTNIYDTTSYMSSNHSNGPGFSCNSFTTDSNIYSVDSISLLLSLPFYDDSFVDLTPFLYLFADNNSHGAPFPHFCGSGIHAISLSSLNMTSDNTGSLTLTTFTSFAYPVLLDPNARYWVCVNADNTNLVWHRTETLPPDNANTAVTTISNEYSYQEIKIGAFTEAQIDKNSANNKPFIMRISATPQQPTSAPTAPPALTPTQAPTVVCGARWHGTVYMPNGVDAVTNVLVFIPSSTPQPFAPGVSCCASTYSLSLNNSFTSTTSLSNGTFSLSVSFIQPTAGDVTTNMTDDVQLASWCAAASFPMVFQAGKWRRQVSVQTTCTCASSLSLSSPSSSFFLNNVSPQLSSLPQSRAQGDIPAIAVVTGKVDPIECLLLKMGFALTEFGDSPFYGGVDGPRINFFFGNIGAGAVISSHTPNESGLFTSQDMLNSYDIVIFACQGSPYSVPASVLSKLRNFADAGGVIIGNHFAFEYLANNGEFSQTATWHVDPQLHNTFRSQSEPAVLNTQTPLYEWTQKVLVDLHGVPVPIMATNMENDFIAVAPGSTLYISVEDANLGTVPLSYSFRTPVTSPPSSQCGAVLFNDFHVENALSTKGQIFPIECSQGAETAEEKLVAQMFVLTMAC